jgi:hypothetical protein
MLDFVNNNFWDKRSSLFHDEEKEALQHSNWKFKIETVSVPGNNGLPKITFYLFISGSK